jgi:hypothetical protein
MTIIGEGTNRPAAAAEVRWSPALLLGGLRGGTVGAAQ